MNRSTVSLPVSVSLTCAACINKDTPLSQIQLRGTSYDSTQVQIDEGAPASLELDMAAGTLTYRNTIEPLSIVILVPPDLTLDKRAMPDDGVRNGDLLTYTLTLGAPGRDAYLLDPLPPHVQYVTHSLTGTVIPTAVYSQTAHAVTWQGRLPAHAAQEISFQVTSSITDTESMDLSAPIANTAWLTDTGSGWSISATSIVNGWQAYLPLTMRND
jgi:hypothetical protein